MKRLAFFLGAVLVASSVPGFAQNAAPGGGSPPIRIRGTIQSLSGDVLTLQPATVGGSAASGPVKITLDPAITVAVTKKAEFSDITTSSTVGATTVMKDGQNVATEVHFLGATAPLNSSPWDTVPQSTMTNGKVSEIGSAAVSGIQNRTLTLTYPDGTKKIVVPSNALIVRGVPGTRDDLTKGQKVFIPRASRAGDGYKAVGNVTVGKDGVDPPQ